MAMSNEELMQILKAITVTSGTEGIASPEDAQEFIDLTTDQTDVLQHIRVETGIVKSRNVDSLFLAEPVSVDGTEATAPAAADVVDVSRRREVLTPTEKLAAFDVSFDFLRKNIRREKVNEDLNAIFSKRMGKDMVMALFMGDTAGATVTRTDKTLAMLDGFVKLALADADVHDYTIPASPSYSSTVFPAMVQALPKDYRDEREDLRFYCSADVVDTYADELGARATALGDAVLAGPWERKLRFKGIRIVPVYGLNTGRIILTLKDNLVVGFGQQITVGRDVYNRSRTVEVTITYEADNAIVEGDALVLGASA